MYLGFLFYLSSNVKMRIKVIPLDLIKVPYLVDVLWGQPIKLIQVASTSELHENQPNDLLFFEIVPCHCCGASEASKIDWLKN